MRFGSPSLIRSHSPVAVRHRSDAAETAAKAFQQARFQQGPRAAIFYTDDVQRDYERMKAAGAEFTMTPDEGELGSAERNFASNAPKH
jgi:glyoxalase/bleomycin resistance protein/dioxygenase superfamily protein